MQMRKCKQHNKTLTSIVSNGRRRKLKSIYRKKISVWKEIARKQSSFCSHSGQQGKKITHKTYAFIPAPLGEHNTPMTKSNEHMTWRKVLEKGESKPTVTETRKYLDLCVILICLLSFFFFLFFSFFCRFVVWNIHHTNTVYSFKDSPANWLNK